MLKTDRRAGGYSALPTRDVDLVTKSPNLFGRSSSTCPAERAGWLSQLFFCWLSPIFTLGASTTLLPGDLDEWPLRAVDSPASHAATMNRAWRAAAAAAGPGADVSFVAACWAAFGRQYMAVGLWKVPYWAALFAQPLILRALLAAIDAHSNEVDTSTLGLLVLGLAMSTLGISLANMHLFVWSQTMGMNVRAGVASLIYTQALCLRPTDLAAAAGPSEILTLLTADTERIVNALSFWHFLYTAPIEIGGAIYLAWQQLGSAAVAGLGVMLLLSPLQTFLGNRIGRLRKSAVRHTDERIRTVAESLHGIATIKMLSAEQYFLRRINGSRAREIETLRRAAVAKMCNASAAFTTQMLVALATFSLHVYLQPDKPPRPEQLFSGLACFNVINNTLSMVPRATEALAEAMVASSRISAFVNLAERSGEPTSTANGALQLSPSDAEHLGQEATSVAIVLRGASFSWKNVQQAASSNHASASHSCRSDSSFCLRDIHVQVKLGQLTAVIGSVGAGKSSFLAALLGELESIPSALGETDCKQLEWVGLAAEAPVAFVAQTPFLLQESVRENILLQHPYVADRYAAVIYACGMKQDVDDMAAGDATEVSEGGSNLSGGQQMRLSLARAAYAALSAEVPGLVLLDDPLSALDNHLGRHVFDHCICGLLKEHTVVMTTHAVHFLHAVDNVILLDNGRVQCVGAPNVVLRNNEHPLAEAFREAGRFEPSLEPKPEPQSDQIPKQDPQGVGASSNPVENEIHKKHVKQSLAKKPNEGNGRLTAQEDRTVGAVVWETYAAYVRAAGGGCSAVMIVALYVIGQVVFVTGDLWLASWSDRNSMPMEVNAGRCDLTTCRCGPFDLSSFRSRTFRAPLDQEGFGTMFRICEDIPLVELPLTCQAAPAPHPAAARYLYALEECSLLGSFGPCPPGVECGLTYEALSGGGVALTYMYDDRVHSGERGSDRQRRRLYSTATSDSAMLQQYEFAPRRLEEVATRPNGCASSLRVELRPGRETRMDDIRLLQTAAMTSGPMLVDPTGPCHNWAVNWNGLNAFGARTPVVNSKSNGNASFTGALASELLGSIGLDTSGSTWMGVYGILTALALVFAVVRSTSFVWLALAAARGLHDTMTATILHAPMRFFDENPRGRLLNRFASDLDKVDSQLPTIAGDTLRLVCTVGGAIAVCLAFLPPLVVALVPCWFTFRRIQRYYLTSSRELARLEAIARSPVYALFTASLRGLPTIRAAHLQPFFTSRFQVALEQYHRPHWLGLAGRRWVAVRFDGIANAVITATALLVLWLRDDKAGGGGLSAGLAGVVLTQALQLVGMFQYAVRQAAETENLMTAVERVRAFTRVRTEGADRPVTMAPPPGWPAAGRLELDRVTLRYAPDLDLALSSVSLMLHPGERLGIVGRSGAGKSSLFGAIFRLVELESGRIMLDGVDCSAINLAALRNVVGIIPQEPLLFSGSLRSNLDPAGVHSEDEIARVLELCSLGGSLRVLTEGQGLNWPLVSGGANLSQGQRQLLCLARALLKQPRVLLLDEATATVDLATDEALQRAVKLEGERVGWSMLTVAHRLQTIMDYDRVAGMAGGQIVELDVPATLLQRKDSLLSLLVRELQPQLQEQLRAMAIAADKKQLGMLSWPSKKIGKD